MVITILFLAFFSVSAFSTPIDDYKNTDISSPLFIQNSFKAARAYLEIGEIEKAITISQFYRQNFLKTKKSQALFFEDSFYQLEIYSLLQLCQWKHAQKLYTEYELHVKNLKRSDEKLLKTKQQITHTQIIKSSTKGQNIALASTKFKDITLYKITLTNISNINHPKSTLIKVENKCESRL